MSEDLTSQPKSTRLSDLVDVTSLKSTTREYIRAFDVVHKRDVRTIATAKLHVGDEHERHLTQPRHAVTNSSGAR
jgi:hypothetical protein